MGKRGALYPKMRERPVEFRINPNWPLYPYLELLCIPVATSSSRGPYWSKAGNLTPILNGNPSVVWYAPLRRFSLLFTRANNHEIIFPSLRYWEDFFTVIMWCHPTSPWEYNQLYTCFSSAREDSSTAALGIKTVQDNKNTYVRFQLEPGYYTPLQSSDVSFDSLYFLAGIWDRWSSSQFLIVNNNYWSTLYYGGAYVGNLNVGRHVYTGYNWNGYIMDLVVFSIALPVSSVLQFSDPSNIDLRFGGIPLILPPTRRFWPIAAVSALLHRRSLGLRSGTREAIY